MAGDGDFIENYPVSKAFLAKWKDPAPLDVQEQLMKAITTKSGNCATYAILHDTPEQPLGYIGEATSKGESHWTLRGSIINYQL
jgi:hypothetical protein